MAIADVSAYVHLSSEDVEEIGYELDVIRRDVEESLGAKDSAYIRRVIHFQRALEVAARLMIAGSRSKVGWAAGTCALAYAKSIENMELGHNISHGQWDWMNDPEIHSNTWEWDMVGHSAQWRYSHNYRHHVYTNVLGMDEDIGYRLLRVTTDQPWRWAHLFTPLGNLVLAATFEWGIALHGLHSERLRGETPDAVAVEKRKFLAKSARQLAKDYVFFPALSLRRWRRTLAANATANVLRNLWVYVNIICGHIPDGAETFDPAVVKDETRGEWYLRQILGTANFNASPLLAFSGGHLCYQIEHHLFPDLPSNRLPEVSVRVRELCEKYDLPYNTASLPRQYFRAQRIIHGLAVPDWLLRVGRRRD
ncbi:MULTISPECIES: acyl-CoA desaturase [unclassified Mycobacterium]|uniref:fatty acid desaturase family protein n=1 Tax=unclassified Mycobacterium TaxID=2642494 RepID=UPI00048BEEBA|nr:MULTISPECIES: acyl-CoA desaturase [unclassified Mycobacterium]SEA62738.1 Fatty acid desaturase [Mycobacterium sp. 283mftsu]